MIVTVIPAIGAARMAQIDDAEASVRFNVFGGPLDAHFPALPFYGMRNLRMADVKVDTADGRTWEGYAWNDPNRGEELYCLGKNAGLTLDDAEVVYGSDDLSVWKETRPQSSPYSSAISVMNDGNRLSFNMAAGVTYPAESINAVSRKVPPTKNARIEFTWGHSSSGNAMCGLSLRTRYQGVETATLFNTERIMVANPSTDTLTFAGHGFGNGDVVGAVITSGSPGVTNFQLYYVMNSTTNTLQLSTNGSSIFDLTGAGEVRIYRAGMSFSEDRQFTINSATTFDEIVITGRVLREEVEVISGGSWSFNRSIDITNLKVYIDMYDKALTARNLVIDVVGKAPSFVCEASLIPTLVQDVGGDLGTLEGTGTGADRIAAAISKVGAEFQWRRTRIGSRAVMLPSLHPRSTVPRWVVDVSDPRVEHSLSGLEVEDLCSSVLVEYRSADGSPLYFTRVSSDWRAYLNVIGREKRDRLTVDTTSRAEAEAIADLYLAEHSRDRVSGSVTTPTLMSLAGRIVPLSRMREGDFVRIRGLKQKQIDARVTEYGLESARLSMSVDTAGYALEMALARLAG